MDVLKAKGTKGIEPMSIVTSKGTYQKGFTPKELKDYVQKVLGKNFDVDLIKVLSENHELLITLEEGSIGGFGSHVVDWLLKNNMINNNLKVRSLFLPDKFIDQASPNVMYKEAGLDVTGITTTILDVLGIADIRSNKIKIIK